MKILPGLRGLKYNQLITNDLLENNGACDGWLTIFNRIFPNGARFNITNFNKFIRAKKPEQSMKIYGNDAHIDYWSPLGFILTNLGNSHAKYSRFNSRFGHGYNYKDTPKVYTAYFFKLMGWR